MIEVGEFIRAIRKKRRLTTTQLADRLGLSNGYISLIERNIVSPSLATLKRIAQVLNIPIESFFLDFDTEVIYSYLKKKEQPQVITEDKNMHYLIDNTKTDLMGACLVNTTKVENVFSASGAQLIYVLEGEAKVKVKKEDYHLKTGDSLYFDASLLHRSNRESPTPTKLLVITTEPEELDYAEALSS